VSRSPSYLFARERENDGGYKGENEAENGSEKRRKIAFIARYVYGEYFRITFAIPHWFNFSPLRELFEIELIFLAYFFLHLKSQAISKPPKKKANTRAILYAAFCV